jgi:hypothetical protein
VVADLVGAGLGGLEQHGGSGADLEKSADIHGKNLPERVGGAAVAF